MSAGRAASRSRLRYLFPLLPVFALLGLVELGATAYRSVYCPGYAPTFALPDPRYGWGHPPGADVHAFGCVGTTYEWSTKARFSSKGLNDHEHAYGREAGVPRVLVLGDSVTEALQVGRADGLSDRLEGMLAAEPSGSVEMINAGTSGYGTDNELLFYEAEGWRYQADVVLLVFNLQNDFAENSPSIVRRMYAGGPEHPKAGLALDADGGLTIDATPFATYEREWKADTWRSSPLVAWMRVHSFLFRRASSLFAASHGAPLPVAPGTYPAELDVYRMPVDAEWRESRAITGALLERLRASVEKRGSRLLVAVVPSRETTKPVDWAGLVSWFPALGGGSWDLESPRRDLDGFLGDHGFASVDTTDSLRRGSVPAGARVFFAMDPHPNAEGQARIAEAIEEPLRAMLKTVPAKRPGVI